MADMQTRLAGPLAGRYRIEREVGAGGMATVFLAHDLKHERDVALKVLHPELGAVIGSERFLQEIKTTARLQHPHILGLIDSGEADGLLFYVMPFVSGESLRNRLTREKQLSIPTALRIAGEVASALDYAHRHGVVHRDIKPENVLLHDGQAMVADFGIALAVTAAGGGRITQTGMSLGTPHYMSPEQAMGEKEITPRADVYALGAMTYEMLTGDPPFTGSSAQVVVAKVLTEKPVPPTSIRALIPPHCEAAILTALAKLPADRWESAREFAEALSNPMLTAATLATSARSAAVDLRRWRLLSGVLGGLLVLTAGWALVVRGREARVEPPPLERYAIVFDAGVKPVDGAGPPIAFAPDGSRLAFLGLDSLGIQAIYLRNLDQPAAVLVPGTRNAIVPFFSPDGQSLGFWDGRLRKVSVAGGTASTLSEIAYPTGASWGPDGIVLSVDGRLVRVSASGGVPEPIAAPDSGSQSEFRWPELTPDGKTLLFTIVDSVGGAELAGMSLPGGRVVRLGVKGMNPHYVSGAGYLAWSQPDGILLAAPFEVRRLRLTGPAQQVAEGIRTGPARVAKLAMSRSGAFAYLSGEAISRELAFLTTDGKTEPLSVRKDLYQAPQISPNGSKIAIEVRHSGVSFSADVWIYDFRTGSFLRLTADSLSHYPAWSADGSSVVYVLDRIHGSVLVRRAADGSGKTDTLVEAQTDIEQVEVGRDGRTVALVENGGRGPDISLGVLDSLAARRPVLATRSNEREISLSPSSKWLAYVSDETGREEVYVRGTGESGGRWPVSIRGGIEPRWAPSGRELYFMSGDSLFAARIADGPDPRPEPPRAVMPLPFFANTLDYAVMRDGRFLWSRYTTGSAVAINLTQHWFERLPK